MFQGLNPFGSSRAAAAPSYAAMVAEGDQAIDARRQTLADELAAATSSADKQGEQLAKALAVAQAAEGKVRQALDQARAARLAAEAACSTASSLRERQITTARAALTELAPAELTQFLADLQAQIDAVRRGEEGPMQMKWLPAVYSPRTQTSEHPVLAALAAARQAAGDLVLRGGSAKLLGGIEQLRKQIALAHEEHVAALQDLDRRLTQEAAAGGRSRPASLLDAELVRAGAA